MLASVDFIIIMIYYYYFGGWSFCLCREELGIRGLLAFIHGQLLLAETEVVGSKRILVALMREISEKKRNCFIEI